MQIHVVVLYFNREKCRIIHNKLYLQYKVITNLQYKVITNLQYKVITNLQYKVISNLQYKVIANLQYIVITKQLVAMGLLECLLQKP